MSWAARNDAKGRPKRKCVGGKIWSKGKNRCVARCMRRKASGIGYLEEKTSGTGCGWCRKIVRGSKGIMLPLVYTIR
jgi:hypothetical protein